MPRQGKSLTQDDLAQQQAAEREHFNTLLHPEEELRLLMREAYYTHLNADPEFQSDLRLLLQDFLAHVERQKKINHLMTEQAVRQTLSQHPHPPNLDALTRFVDRWHLPISDGMKDLRQALHDASTPAELRLSAHVWTIQDYACPASIAVVLPMVDHNGNTYRWRKTLPAILPPCPLPFEYDPTTTTHAWVRDYAKMVGEEVRKSIMAQAEDLERQLLTQGWRMSPPQYHHPDTLRIGAHRLYLRAIEKKTWAEIGKETHAIRSAVCEQVQSWSDQLGVPIPRDRTAR